MSIIYFTSDLKLSLRHHDLIDLSIAEFQIYWQDSNSNLVMNLNPACSTRWRLHYAFAGERVPGADHRVSCKRNFASWCVDAKSAKSFLITWRQYENCFREI